MKAIADVQTQDTVVNMRELPAQAVRKQLASAFREIVDARVRGPVLDTLCRGLR